MRYSKKLSFFLSCVCWGALWVVVYPTVLPADDGGAATPSGTEELDRDAFLGQISMSYLQDGFQDRVDGFSGYLHINMVDVRLPGDAGMEIVVQRYYSSNVWNRVDNYTTLTRHAASADPGDRLGGSGWQLHMGKIIDPFPTPGPGNQSTLIMPDGSSHPLFSRSGYAGQKITLEGWIYTYSGGIHEVTLTDGSVYQFDETATGAQYRYHNGSLTPVVQCTRIEDVNGNAIDIEYDWVESIAPYYKSRIESISFDKTGDNRAVEFTYFSGTNRIDEIRVKDGSTTLQVWEFGYGSPQGTFLQMDSVNRTVYPLTGLTPPEGDPWEFDYYSSSSTPGNGRYLLEEVTFPNGGMITYQYEPEQFETGSQTCSDYPEFAAIESRTVKESDTATIGEWTYVYTDGGEENATTDVTVKDGSNNTVRTEEHVFHGWDSWSVSDLDMWNVGRSKQVTIKTKSSPTTDLDIVTETTVWQKGSSISSDTRKSSLWDGCASNRQMSGVNYVIPTSVTRVVTRTDSNPDSDYTTTTTDFDDWGNPGLVTESSDDGLSRTTEIEYWQDTTYNIKVGRIEARDPDPGGTECLKYDSRGRVIKKFINPRTDDVTACGPSTPSYARETRYDYDSTGNLTQETRENNSDDLVTRFDKYSFGQPEEIEVENGTSDILLCKDIGPLGTVAWETDGRGTSCTLADSGAYRTSYEYDGLGRLTEVAPPLGNPTSFSYADDWSTVTVTRGAYDVQYSFDGLGRLSERSDLETLHKLELEYDPLGTRSKATAWFDDEKADTLDYDSLGRLTTITHSDNETITFSYDGSKVTRTDEENRETEYHYEAFGSPEDRRLARLVDAENKTWEYAYDTTYGMLATVDAPISKGDRSFTYYANDSNYWNGFLETEDHPETGDIDYEYDRLGNVTLRERANGTEDTVYEYDDARRLIGIDYPLTADDVTIDYDNAGNRTLLQNNAATIDFAYDTAGRLEYREYTINVGVPRTYKIDYEYDAMNRIDTITYPSGRVIEYGYDNRNWVTSVAEETPSTAEYITAITYHDTGAADLTTFANGVTTDIGLDTRFRIETIETGGGGLMDVEIGYDDASNITGWTDHRDSAGSRTFTYDDVERLLTANAAGMWGSLSFTYDDLGNRLTRTLAGSTTTYSYGTSTNRLDTLSGAESATYLYDAQGRPTQLTAPDLSPPGEVTGLTAVAQSGGSEIKVSWTNPSDPDLDQVFVRHKTTGYPTSTSDGDELCAFSSPTPGAAVSCTDTEIPVGTQVFYRVFTADEGPNYSDGLKISERADTCTDCDADLMVGVSTGDIKGVENTGVLGVPPPTWAVHPDWDFPDATGSNAAPELADLDNDGDLDMLVGFSDGRYKVYRNSGSQKIPYWVENSGWAPTFDIGGYAVPTMGDLDGDGDLDIIAGNSNGEVEAYENNGDAENPGTWTVASSWTSDIADVGTFAAPELLDLDGDGILDLLIGNQTGTCTAYRNSASSAPSWSRSAGWDIPDQSAYAVPTSADLDDDGDYDILLGDRYGSTCKAWENTGSTASPAWTRNATWDVSIAGDYTAPALGDLDREAGPMIFEDGFESGDTSAWSDTDYGSQKTATSGGLRDLSRTSGHISRWRDDNGEKTSRVRRGFSNGPSLLTTVEPAPIASKAITNDVFAYSFNAADSLTQVSWQHGVIEDYTYDGDGLRIKKIAGSDEIVYIRDRAGNVIAEYDQDNTLLAEYVYANGHQVAKVEPDGGAGEDISFFHSDHLGTALVITDESGALTWRGEYYPFGEEYSSEGTPNRYRFVERELDTSTGLSYMRARYYDPHLGRFLSMDPVGGRTASPQSWNRYAYVLNNPVNMVDPDGQLANWAVGALIGAAIGGGGELIRQAVAGEDINIRNIGAAAAGGLVSGAIAGGTFGASLIAQAGVRGAVIAGSVSNVAGGAVQRELDSSQDTAALSEAMFIDAAVGGVGGGLGHTVETAARTAQSGQINALQQSIQRRSGIVEGRLSRGAPAMSAGQKLARDQARLAAVETTTETAGTVAGTVSTNAAAPIVVQSTNRQLENAP